jgi:hypothetical protein
MKDYNKQALDFLEKTGTTFKAEYLRTGKFFPSDEEERDIYKITLKRGSRSYSFEFGQSIRNSGYKIVGKYYSRNQINPFLHNGKVFGHEFASKYFTLSSKELAEIVYPITPNEYDVLACLTKYDPGTFKNFCDEFGYDEDSKKAEKTYNAVVDEYKNICALYSDTELEEMQEIQ